MIHSLPLFNWTGLHILQMQQSADELALTACAAAPNAVCPACGQVSARIHSRYQRTLTDLPCCGTPVRLCLQVRRFLCPSTACPRRTFVEQVEHLTAPHAQRTVRLNEWLARLGLACGGERAARLSQHLQMPASPDTFLRRVRSLPLPPAPTPRVLGVDDWAWRKGRSYGTILCDLERHCPVDLLADRSADSLAAWLRAHPGVEIICRDRASAYADGAAQGAPDAIQVADRFHLLKNLTDAVTSILTQHRRALQRSSDSPAAVADPPAPQAEATPASEVPQPLGQPLAAAPPSAAQAARLARYEEMVRLREAGLNQALIARRLGVSQRTVNAYLSGSRSAEPKPRQAQASYLDPYLPYLSQRWEEGCHKVVQLWREISAQGYTHGRGLVHQYAARLRQGERPLRMSTNPTAAPPAAAPACYPPREAVWLLMRPPTALNETERKDLAAMQQQCPALATAYQLAQSFTEMLRERHVARLGGWVQEASSSGLAELRSFANGIERDKAAVVAAFTWAWSSGQVEGQVNRLKLVKREMYGRAKLDLLRRRVLLRI